MYKKRKWLKNKGYLHITQKINIKDKANKKTLFRLLYHKNSSNDWNELVSKHAFFPLLYREIIQRKVVKKDGEIIKHREKIRPIHYSTHIDAHIYAKFANDISVKYEGYLRKNPVLSECIIGYRSIEKDENSYKSTITFANEVFQEIKKRKDCFVLTFDVKKFFSSLNHQYLKSLWSFIINSEPNSLPYDHYNIYKAVTKFSYIRLDELRNRKNGFDEKKLAELRKEGIFAFFKSPEDFRNYLNSGKIHLYKNQFKRNGKLCGIPQGLPISAILANIYMLKFDEEIFKELINKYNFFYRRYSDDIIVVCDNKEESIELVKKTIHKEIAKCQLSLAIEKTEIFHFENSKLNPEKHKKPLKYLGFEFYGDKILIKSENLASYYRKMKRAIRLKKRILEKVKDNIDANNSIFKKQLYFKYTIVGKNKKIRGKKYGNFLGYVARVFKEIKDNSVNRQLRNHLKIFKRELNK